MHGVLVARVLPLRRGMEAPHRRGGAFLELTQALKPANLLAPPPALPPRNGPAAVLAAEPRPQRRRGSEGHEGGGGGWIWAVEAGSDEGNRGFGCGLWVLLARRGRRPGGRGKRRRCDATRRRLVGRGGVRNGPGAGVVAPTTRRSEGEPTQPGGELSGAPGPGRQGARPPFPRSALGLGSGSGQSPPRRRMCASPSTLLLTGKGPKRAAKKGAETKPHDGTSDSARDSAPCGYSQPRASLAMPNGTTAGWWRTHQPGRLLQSRSQLPQARSRPTATATTSQILVDYSDYLDLRRRNSRDHAFFIDII